MSALAREYGGSKRNALLKWCQKKTEGYQVPAELPGAVVSGCQALEPARGMSQAAAHLTAWTECPGMSCTLPLEHVLPVLLQHQQLLWHSAPRLFLKGAAALPPSEALEISLSQVALLKLELKLYQLHV